LSSSSARPTKDDQ